MPALRISPALLAIVASVAIVSVLAWSSRSLRNALVLVPVRVRRAGEVHRLLTAGWIHADVAHLVFNMLTLYFFAHDVERGLGTIWFVVLYVSAVVVAYIPTTLRHMNNPTYASLGASGAVSAVMLSAVLLNPRLTLHFAFVPIPIPGLVYALGYLAYSAYRSYRPRDGINHAAHFAGAVYGALLTFALAPGRVQSTVQRFFG